MKNETLNILKTRRSIRKFKPQQISEAELAAVLEAGTYAPTGHGAQAPIIVAVQDKDAIATLSKMNAKIMGSSSDPYYGAPTILLVLVDKTRSNVAVEDGSSVATYLLLAAHALGLGACWINREKEMFDSAEGKALLAQWGITGDYIGVAACSLGYADQTPEPAPRKKDYIYHV